MHRKTIIFLSLISLLLCGCVAKSDEDLLFDVIFKNYDGTVLYRTTAKYEGAAVYRGLEPTREPDGYIFYEFRGWDKDINWIVSDTITIAQYKEIYDTNNESYTNGRFEFKQVEGGYEIKTFYGFIYGSEPNKEKEKLVLPSKYLGEKVVSIGERAFYNNRDFSSIVFGKYIETIGADAFNSCRISKSFVFNDKLKRIEKNAFKNCTYMEQIKFPSSLEYIGDYAFTYCGIGDVLVSRTWTRIDIPKSIEYIGKQAFYTNSFADSDRQRIFTFYCEASAEPFGFHSEWNLAGGFVGMTGKSGPVYHNVVWGAN